MDPSIILSMIAMFSAVGTLASCIARFNQKYIRRWKSTIRILYSDYVFDEYATITLLSLLYALGVGGLTGAAIGSFIASLASNSGRSDFFLAGIGLLLLVPILRVTIEGYTVIYKTASVASRFFELSSTDLIQRDPTLSQYSPWETSQDRVETNFGYSKEEIFKAIMDELKELGTDTSSITYGNTSFTHNRVIVVNNHGRQVAVFTKHPNGEWSREMK